MRRLLSSVLALLSAALLLGAAGLLWTRREVLDSDRFAHHTRAGLTSEAVRTLLTDEITGRVVAGPPEASPEVEQRVREEVAVALGSPVFADVFEQAVARVHQALLAQGRERPVLDLSGADALVRDAVAGADARLARLVPDGFLSAVDVGDRAEFPHLRDLDERVDGALRRSLLGALGAAAAAFAVAARRHRPAVVGGLGLAAGAVVLFMASAAAPSLAASQAHDDVGHAAVRAVVEEMASPLRWHAGGLGVLGLAVALVGVTWARRPAPAGLV